MQIIARRANEGILIDGQTTVTVVEIGTCEVTLDVTGPDGRTQRLTLACSETEIPEAAERELVSC